ncbi:FN3 associated domain-containing protein [Kiritimatiellota bacterium B12222]|nr:FN3 associated domain-containing protein [Kiritimatiellota bacterium B12222]
MMRFFTTILLGLMFSTGGMRLFAQRPQGSDQSFTDIIAYGSGALTLTDEGEVMQSIDAGNSYSELFDHDESLFGLGVSGQTVIAVGTDGVIFVSDFSIDPLVWDEKSTPAIIGDLRAVSSNGASVWHAVGDAIFRSTDNGVTWEDVSPVGMESMNDIVFTGTGSNWVAVGGDLFDGQAFYSSDGGANWVASTLPPFTPVLNGVAVDAAGNILAVGEAGTVLLSTDQGQSFSALSATVTQDLNGVVATADNEWLIGGTQRVLLSVDSSTDSSVTILNEAGAVVAEDQGNDIALVGDSVIIAGAAEVLAPQIQSTETTSFTPIEVTVVPGAGSEYTFYTTDGSEPDDGDMEYASPFDVSATLTVKAVSQLDGVYSAVVSEDFTITLHTLSITPDGVDIDLHLDTSVLGYSYQLISNDNLMNEGGWVNAGAAKSGTGNPLDWSIVNPSSPLFWQVEITQAIP